MRRPGQRSPADAPCATRPAVDHDSFLGQRRRAGRRRSLTNVIVTLQQGFTVSGRVSFPGATARPPANLNTHARQPRAARLKRRPGHDDERRGDRRRLGQLHDHQRGARFVSIRRRRRRQRLVPRIGSDRRPGHARRAVRGEARQRAVERGDHVHGSPVAAHRHHHQPAWSARTGADADPLLCRRALLGAAVATHPLDAAVDRRRLHLHRHPARRLQARGDGRRGARGVVRPGVPPADRRGLDANYGQRRGEEGPDLQISLGG